MINSAWSKREKEREREIFLLLFKSSKGYSGVVAVKSSFGRIYRGEIFNKVNAVLKIKRRF